MLDKQRGFILPLAVIIIFSISSLLIHLMTRIVMLPPMERMVLEREQAKQLALMGITLVQGQLMLPFKMDKDKQEFYKQLLPLLNTWQSFTLKEDVDGIDGNIDLYVACEDGKIPLNTLWKFKEKKFIAPPDGIDVKKLFANVVFAGKGSEKDQPVMERLETFLKTQESPLEDLTDLWTDKNFSVLAENWLPAPSQAGSEKKQEIYFGDFFTVAFNDPKIQPAFLSSGVQQMLGVKQINDKEKYKEALKKLTDGLKTTMNWQQQWDNVLGSFYGITYAKVPEDAKKLFNDQVGASLISVVSYGKVGMVTQKLFAILSQNVDSEGNVTYTIRKLYWA